MDKTFLVQSIGSGQVEEKTSVQISRQYIKALKYLSLFSHCIVFYRETGNEAIFQETLKIISINEKNGICLFSKTNSKDRNIELLDIKPYFPCEDRVKNATFSFSTNEKKTTIDRTKIPYGKIEKHRGKTYVNLNETSLPGWLSNCSHIKIFWWFHKFDKAVYRKTTECDPPYENAPRTGIFASRSPVRPNPIALTTARIKSTDKENARIETSALDCFDGTPLLGIAPYNPDIDKVDNASIPYWLEHWPSFFIEEENNTGLIECQDSPLLKLKSYSETKTKSNSRDIFGEQPEKQVNNDEITVVGARQNNLKNITVSIPHHKTTVVTGVSGSGKSSLVFDTIFAESQYRFFENTNNAPVSGGKLPGHPEFDAIQGLTPAIAVAQNNVNRNPRSTFGTVTGLYDLLRSLFAAVGTRHCPHCGRAVVPLSVESISENLYQCKDGTVLSIAPYGKPDNTSEIAIDRNPRSYRLLKQMVAEKTESGKGAILVTINHDDPLLLQTTQMCYDCQHPFFELTPATFSFNNPESSCPVCNGTGELMEIDSRLIVAHPERSILDSASDFWGDLRKFRESPNANWMKGEVLALAGHMNIDLELPWNQLSNDFQNKALLGSDGKEVTFSYKNKNGRTGHITRPAEGAVNTLKRLLTSGTGAERIMKLFASVQRCPACLGERLNREGRLVTIAGKRIPELVDMPVSGLEKWVKSLPESLSATELEITKPILKELCRLCKNYQMAGLSYITLNRNTATLSGGELQRTRLVKQLVSGITNVTYILDEPFVGLHRLDAERLFSIIEKLKTNGNTVIMVEHHREVMLKADHIIDIGPGAGVRGGEIVAEGSPRSIMNNPKSQTGLYLSDKKSISANRNYTPDVSKSVTLKGARAHNLKGIDITFLSGSIVCICGVSGSGKSSLVKSCLYPAVNEMITGKTPKNKQYDTITGADIFDKIIFVDQKPIGRNSRSTPATYTGLMDEIRSLFSKTESARERGYTSGRFSYNNKDGQCSECKGEGVKHINLPFIANTDVECPVCKGKQFNKETLEIVYNGKNIAEVMQLSIDEALHFFGSNVKICRILQTLYDVGLGYLKLGQSSLTLSGGEAQRIKLATELCTASSGQTLYILDEPSGGLHFEDVRNLMTIFQKMAANGNTIVMVEHNEDIIKNADTIIELGPEGGKNGGFLIRQENLRTANKRLGNYSG